MQFEQITPEELAIHHRYAMLKAELKKRGMKSRDAANILQITPEHFSAVMLGRSCNARQREYYYYRIEKEVLANIPTIELAEGMYLILKKASRRAGVKLVDIAEMNGMSLFKFQRVLRGLYGRRKAKDTYEASIKRIEEVQRQYGG
jgi:hypothetical protein